LFAATYAELRKLARGRLRATSRNTLLDTSSLVHESYSGSPAPVACGDDLRRWLDGRPVVARPDSAWYRISKFTRRHMLGVVVACAAMLAVLAGAGAAVWQWRVAAGCLASIVQNSPLPLG
jgi:hypothetical protein